MVRDKKKCMFIATILVALISLSGCLEEEKERPAETPVQVEILGTEETEAHEVSAAIEPISCQPQTDVGGTLNVERLTAPAEMLPLFALRAVNVTIIGRGTGQAGGVTVNVTVLRADNETVYAYNITVDNVSIGVIRDNFTITHPVNLSPVDVLKANVTRVLNLTGVKQKTDSTCAPTGAGAIIEFYNKTFPSIMGNRNRSALIEELARTMNTSANGTKIGGIIDGLTQHLNNTGKSGNFTIEAYLNVTSTNITVTLNRTIILVVNNSGKPAFNVTVLIKENHTLRENISLPDNKTVNIPANLSIAINESVNVTIPANFSGTIIQPIRRTINTSAAVTLLNTTVNGVDVGASNRNINYTGIKKEFIDKNQMVLVGVLIDGRGHVMALDDLGTMPKANGKYDVSFMDPATGTTFVTEMDSDGSFDYYGRKGVVTDFISLSPK